ncbi:MAG: type III-B CRISPR module RAMP protein Cmr1, partial [Calditrichaeota bacterium]|nr:type III-B CRISPR module RAMP protein Cmr1 [Calditrichota bacterium]
MRPPKETPLPLPLPLPLARRCRRGSTRSTLTLDLETVTPVLGGSAVAGSPDRIEGVRPSSIRGSLRFWWRALQASTDRISEGGPGVLFEEESNLWGGLGASPIRSRV